MYPILYLIVPLIWSACCATAEVALNKVGFYSNEVQTMGPSGEPSGPDNEGGTLAQFREGLLQAIGQKRQAQSQLRAEIDLLQVEGWSYTDMRHLTMPHRALAREIRALKAELAPLERLSSDFRYLHAT